MIEIWKDIDNYKGYYQVSNFGRIKSLRRRNILNSCWIKERILKCWLTNKLGYLQVVSYKYKRKQYYCHRLVAKAFISNPDNKPEVNHKDGNKENNRVINLEWCTSKGNMHHADIILGINCKGENLVYSKLTVSDILQIRESKLKHKELAKIYSVSQPRITAIKNNKKWKHI